MSFVITRRVVSALLGVVLVAGCASHSPETADLKTGPGVTPREISLGVLTDLSGPYSPLGKKVVRGNQLYVDWVNTHGGVCGRQLKLVVRDHGYHIDKAGALYSQMEPQVAGFVQLLGSAISKELQPDMLHDDILTAPTSGAAELLDNPDMMVVGTTYDIDVINGIDYLLRQNQLRAGDRIGHIYLQDEYGGTALRGSQSAAAQAGLTLQELPITVDVSEFETQLAALKTAGAKAVVLSTTPSQAAAAVGAAATLNYPVTFLLNTAAFDPKVLAGAAKPGFEQHALVVSSIAPFDAAIPGPREVAKAYRSTFPDQDTTIMVNYGYTVAVAYTAVLNKACSHKDLSRQGMLKALRELTEVDTNGITAPLKFSLAGHPSTTKTMVLRSDSGTPGGLVLVEGPFESALARQGVH